MQLSMRIHQQKQEQFMRTHEKEEKTFWIWTFKEYFFEKILTCYQFIMICRVELLIVIYLWEKAAIYTNTFELWNIHDSVYIQ